MHRGSSKAPGPHGPGSETLPLSASSPPLTISVRIARGSDSPDRSIQLAAGSRVRDLLKLLDRPMEGSAVLVGGRLVPLDAPVEDGTTVLVVPTFSGG